MSPLTRLARFVANLHGAYARAYKIIAAMRLFGARPLAASVVLRPYFVDGQSGRGCCKTVVLECSAWAAQYIAPLLRGCALKLVTLQYIAALLVAFCATRAYGLGGEADGCRRPPGARGCRMTVRLSTSRVRAWVGLWVVAPVGVGGHLRRWWRCTCGLWGGSRGVWWRCGRYGR